MTLLALVRMFGALALVLGLLAGALWAVRRFDLRLPGGLGRGGAEERRLEVVERLTVDQKRSLLLVRRDNVEHLVLMSPEGNVLLNETRVATPAMRIDQPPMELPAPRQTAPALPSFDAESDGGEERGSTAFLGNLHLVHSFARARLARHA